MLRAPSALLADNDPYDTSVPRTRISTRDAGGFAAVYRPMAEGVSTRFARDPAVAAAGLDPEEFTRLFVALIDQESRFNPGAVSPKGARGLGQLMPGTAAVLGVADPFEPMANLRGAARYLVDQLRAFGRADLALAAYNAGPHRVARYQGIPPFRETRDYVARITRAAGLGPRGEGLDAAMVQAAAVAPIREDTPRRAVVAPALLTKPAAPRFAASEPVLASALKTSPRTGSVLEWTD